MTSRSFPTNIQQITSTAQFSSPHSPGVLNLPQSSAETAQTLAELLQKNHDTHHLYTDEDKRHNHIAHYLLALYDFGASPSRLRSTYEKQCHHQRGFPEVHDKVVHDLRDETKWDEFIAKGEHYGDFLTFFTREIKEIGWQKTIHKWLFSGTPLAERLLANAYSGLYHPWIHLGYGIEFQIPAVIAEGLAMFASSDLYMGDALIEMEKAARQSDSEHNGNKTVIALAIEMASDPIVSKAAKWEDPNKFRSILTRAQKEITALATQWRCNPDNLVEKAAEATSAGALLCVGAIRPDKIPTYDFFLIHILTSTLFTDVLINQDWVPTGVKCRLLNWKVWTDLVTYTSRGTPKLYPNDIQNYTPKLYPRGNPWLNLIDRVIVYEDKTIGHAVKVVRALAHGEQICRPYVGKSAFEIQGDMWWKAAAMFVDGLEEGGPEYVFSTGFNEAWTHIGLRK